MSLLRHLSSRLLLAALLLTLPASVATATEEISADTAPLRTELLEYSTNKTTPMEDALAALQKQLKAKGIPLKLKCDGDVPAVNYDDDGEYPLREALDYLCTNNDCGYVLRGDTVTLYADGEREFRSRVKIPAGMLSGPHDVKLSKESHTCYIHTCMGTIRIAGVSEVKYDPRRRELMLQAPARAIYTLDERLKACEFIIKLDSVALDLACKGKPLRECMEELRRAMQPDFGHVDLSFMYPESKTLNATMELENMSAQTPRAILRALAEAAGCDYKIHPRQPAITMMNRRKDYQSKTWDIALDPRAEGYDYDDAALNRFLNVTSRSFTRYATYHYDAEKKQLTVFSNEEIHADIDRFVAEYDEYCEKRKLYTMTWKFPRELFKNKELSEEFSLEQLQEDPEEHLYQAAGAFFFEIPGSYALFKGSKLTVCQRRDAMTDITNYIESFSELGYKVTTAGKMKEVRTKPARMKALKGEKKEKKGKKKKK